MILAHVASPLAAFLSTREEGPVTITDIQATPLSGGYVAQRVARLDVSFVDPRGKVGVASFVQKHTSPREITVMRLLRPLASTEALPYLIDAGQDTVGTWMLIPFIQGAKLDGVWQLQPDVLSALVQVHTRFTGQSTDIAFLPRVDQSFWQRLLDNLQGGLTAAPWSPDAPARSAIQRGIESLRCAAHVPATLMALPPTLLHGDVHGGNMIACSTDGKTYLFDWGNARIGPAAVDLVNCIASPDAPEWDDYWTRVAAVTGQAPSTEERLAGYHAARVLISVQYLPSAIRFFGPDHATGMLQQALAAAAALRRQPYCAMN